MIKFNKMRCNTVFVWVMLKFKAQAKMLSN